MLLVSTTTMFCQGDDFIRGGVLRLLGIPDRTGVMWFDRYNKQRANMPDMETCLNHAQALVFAGTPAWLDNEVKWYEAAIKTKTPIWLIGVRAGQKAIDVLKKARGLVRVATCGDSKASKTLKRAGIPHRVFLDPAFHAPYFVPKAKDMDVVLTYRRKEFGGEPDAKGMAVVFSRVYNAFKDRIGAVVVHEPHEVPIAKRLFGVTPFFDHDPARYANIYGRARSYIGGRFHGAVPTLAMGGEAHLIHGSTWGKIACLRENADWLPVRVYKPEDVGKIKTGLSRSNAQERVQADYAAHRAYLAAHLPEISEDVA